MLLISKISEHVCRMVMRISVMRHKVTCASSVCFYGMSRFRGVKGRVSVGDNTIIRSGEIGGNCVGINSNTYFCVLGNGHIGIGNNVGISNSLFVSTTNISVADDVMIGGGCSFYDSDFHSLDYCVRTGERDNSMKSAPICVERGAFIGAHSIILKGVTIGERSIIGAGSVVTKSVPANEIWAGNPAKKIRQIEGGE